MCTSATVLLSPPFTHKATERSRVGSVSFQAAHRHPQFAVEKSQSEGCGVFPAN